MDCDLTRPQHFPHLFGKDRLRGSIGVEPVVIGGHGNVVVSSPGPTQPCGRYIHTYRRFLHNVYTCNVPRLSALRPFVFWSFDHPMFSPTLHPPANSLVPRKFADHQFACTPPVFIGHFVSAKQRRLWRLPRTHRKPLASINVLPPQLAEGVQHVSHGQQFFLHLLPLPRGQYGDPVDVVPPPLAAAAVAVAVAGVVRVRVGVHGGDGGEGLSRDASAAMRQLAARRALTLDDDGCVWSAAHCRRFRRAASTGCCLYCRCRRCRRC